MEKTKPTEWEAVEPNRWKPRKKGEVLEGVLTQKWEPSGEYHTRSYVIENGYGMHLVFGTAVLTRRMELIKIGERVRIVFDGVEKNKNRYDTQLYQVFRGKDAK